MKLQILLPTIAVTWTLTASTAAASARVTGTVRAADASFLPDVRVTIEGVSVVSITDAQGRYALGGLAGGMRVTVVATLSGFRAARHELPLVPGDNTLDIVMEVGGKSENVDVTGELPLLQAGAGTSHIVLAPRQIASLPSLGERDIFRTLQLLPGISGSHEASSGLYVRGGTPDQNLVSYDGFTVYHVDHLFGYFSAFNMEAVDEVRLSKGAYEARYGGRLSSVMELVGRAGRTDRFSGTANLSLLSAGAVLAAPLGGKGSLLLAGRRSFQSPLYDKILGLTDDESGGGPGGGAVLRPSGGGGGGGGGGGAFGARPFSGGGGPLAAFESTPKSYFFDLNGKLVYDVTSRDRIELSVYGGRDDFDNSRSLSLPSFTPLGGAAGFAISGSIESVDLATWSNRGGSAAWSRRWSGHATTRLTVGRSTYDEEREQSSTSNLTRSGDAPEGVVFSPRAGAFSTDEDNALRDTTLRLDNTIVPAAAHRLDFGLELTRADIDYRFGSELPDLPVTEDGAPRGRLLVAPGLRLDRSSAGTIDAGYLQHSWSLAKRVNVTSGLRAARFDGTGETYLEPRFSATAGLSDRVRVKGAWGRYHQFVQRITREDRLQGDREFWTVADGATVPVSGATHIVAGAAFESSSLLVDVEAFDKHLSDLTEFAPRLRPDIATEDPSRFFFHGTGHSRGVELLVQKKSGRNTGWLGYTLSRTERELPGLEDGVFPATHDQRHELKLVDMLRLGHWTVAGTWIFATGKPYTAPSGLTTLTLEGPGFPGFGFDVVEFDRKNGARLPAYHRLDLAVNYEHTLGPGRVAFGVTVFNLYDRSNVWSREFVPVEGEIVENDVTLMGRTLNVSASYRF
jgi:ferric enterobactin receptor